MDLGIAGRKAIVNGGSAGMGKASAFALAREGVDLVISARGEERLIAACKEIATATGVRVTPIATDHSTAEGRERILAACPEPDILVATCSPPPQSSDYRLITNEEWMQTLTTALLSPVEFMKATVDGMVQRGWGRVVNISTAAAKYPTEVRLLSGPPRAALSNYTAAVARKVARHNVAINNVLPGMFHTAATADRFTALAARNGTTYDEEVQKFAKDWRIPARRFGDPDELGALVALLCSQYAGFTVGQSFVVDGGIGIGTF